MGRLFVATVLMSTASKPAAKAAEIELEPIERGAWATWAKAWRDEQPEPVEAAAEASALATTTAPLPAPAR